MFTRFYFLRGLLAIVLAGQLVASRPAQRDAIPAGQARLLLFLTIDQARYDYLTRFRSLYRGGLKYLLERGVVFANAHHNHASTSTGPGHASLATGLYPRNSGIIGNSWYDRKSRQPVYCVEDPSFPLLGSNQASSGRSPRHLLAPGLADWIKQKNPKSKVFVAGGKDRSAVLVGGKTADAAYWFDSRTGQWVSSRYYLKAYPEWLQEFAARKIPDAYFGKTWEPLPVEVSDYRRLGVERVDAGFYGQGFPRPLGGLALTPNPSFYSGFYASPFMDLYLLELARALVENESLGSDEDLDFLGLCFSVLDSVGHSYGPNSPEVLDVCLRLDRALGEFFDFLEARVGLQNVLICVSSDHGVMTLPEYLKMKDLPGGRLGLEDLLCYQRSGLELAARLGEGDWFLQGFYLNYETIGRHNLRRQEVEEEVARLLERCPSVARVWTRTELESGTPRADPFFELFSNSFHPGRSPDLLVQLKEYHLASAGTGTSHGSAYDYDTHVPLLLAGPGLLPRTVSERVHTVDVAPTLAALLQIPVPGKVDGVSRQAWLGSGKEAGR